jgi:putative transposase
VRDEHLKEGIFDTLTYADHKPALWHYEYSNVRPNSSLDNQSPAEARRSP